MAIATRGNRSRQVKTKHEKAQLVRPVMEVRSPKFEFRSDIPRNWYDDNPLATMLWAAFSITLPEGEHQFIHSVRHYRDQISDPELKQRVKTFVGQEAHHAKAHDALNAFLKARGYAVDKVLNDLRKLIELERQASPKAQLALTVTAEHYTAMIADFFVSKHPEELDKMHPELARLWAWHAIEEIEHKSVAFDVYMDVIGDRAYLQRMMLLQSFFITRQMATHMWMFARDAGELTKPKSLLKGAWYFLRPSSILWSNALDYARFFKPGFHPWQHDNRIALIKAKRRYL
jgi:uncharacterized protein